MNWNLVSIVLILSLVGCAAALDVRNGVEMRPGEAAAEKLFEKGIGQPWVGGNPPSFSSVWGWGHDRFSYYDYQGKTYDPYHSSYPYTWGWGSYPFSYYDYQGKTYNPYRYSYPYTYYGGYHWS